MTEHLLLLCMWRVDKSANPTFEVLFYTQLHGYSFISICLAKHQNVF